MNTVSKTLNMVFVFVLLASLMVLPTGLAQTELVVPMFSIVEISSPYDVPPTYTTDPYTGETKLTNPGYHVENKTTYIKIKNQPFAQPNNGSTFHLYYQYRYKGHYSNDDWYLVPYAPQDYIEQTDSDYTLIPYTGATHGEVDIQTRALIGFVTYIPNYMAPGGFAYCEFNGVEGDWSSTQTLTFDPSTSSPILPSPSNLSPINPNPSSTSNPNNPPQQTPQQPKISNIIILLCIITIILSATGYFFYKPIKNKHSQNIL